MSEFNRPWFFNLFNDGDEAIVRLLHTSVSTIESELTHRVEVDGKKKRIKCVGTDCPLCASGNQQEKRIYLHLIDYTDNKEKVWDRTDKIIPELEKLEQNWSPLCSAVVKIKRIGNEFPKYEVSAINPTNYEQANPDLIDANVSKYFRLSRTKEAIETFLSTGKFPERPEFIPKEEYFAKKEAEKKASSDSAQVIDSDSDQKDEYTSMFDNNNADNSNDVFGFDPFSSNTVNRPRRF